MENGRKRPTPISTEWEEMGETNSRHPSKKTKKLLRILIKGANGESTFHGNWRENAKYGIAKSWQPNNPGTTNNSNKHATPSQRHIAAVKHTHIDQDLNLPLNGYRIITSASKQNINKAGQIISGVKTGGVSIIVNLELEHHISSIGGKWHRLLNAALHGPRNNIPITTLVPYAPRKGLGGGNK